MLTPYDWQEGIGHRAQYVENKLSQGAPVFAISVAEGILIFTYRRSAHKIFEVYDRLAFAAIGQQSDVEALRVAAIDFAHQEGFNRSEQDVTLERVVTALSGPVKKAFADFSTSPFVLRALFAEVGTSPKEDHYSVLEYDGDFNTTKRHAFVAATDEQRETIKSKLEELSKETPTQAAAEPALVELWNSVLAENAPEDVVLEKVLLDRSPFRENRFRALEVAS